MEFGRSRYVWSCILLLSLLFGEFPSRYTFSFWVSLDIVDGSAIVRIATQLVWLLVGLESLWEGIFIDVVLVVKFWHRVAALLL